MARKRKDDSEPTPVEEEWEATGEEDELPGTDRVETAGNIFRVLLLLLVVGFSAAFIYLQFYLSRIKSLAEDAVPELWVSGDGTCELSWRGLEAAGADFYYVKVGTYALGGGSGQEILFSGYVDGTSCSLPVLPEDEAFVFQMDLLKKSTVLGKEHIWKQATVERFFSIRTSAIKDLGWKVDSDAGKVLFDFDFHEGNCCGIYVAGEQGGGKLLGTVLGDSVELDLNAEEELWIPMPGNPCTLMFVPGNCVNGMAVYGGEPREMWLTWEDFAAQDVQLSMDMIDGCVCRLKWDGPECDFYEIQMMDGGVGAWETVAERNKGEECTYISPRLNPGAEYSFRVVAVAGEYAAVSEVCECEPAVTPMYCTVWPVRDLEAYSDAAKSKEVGAAGTLDAYCVVDVQDNMFGINMDGRVCYIDSNYCMINLPEYVGTLCSYDITNSYGSVFTAHGFGIPGLTGETISGFEDVRLYDGSFLVPLLYPTARKLEAAIEDACGRGYRLKIYEAFRPHEASVYMYRKASEVQDTTLPESTYWGEEPGGVLSVRETDEYGAIIQRRKTYWELMNDYENSFTLGAFVSAGVSRHNLGVAMDLTLENLYTGEELTMQTKLHDLSHYSARAQNNGCAKELSEIMTSAGYRELYSEWWHFQDDEIRRRLSLPCVNQGVSPECWMTNGFGWRYRKMDGSYAVDCTLAIDGVEYTFDSDGYVTQGQPIP